MKVHRLRHECVQCGEKRPRKDRAPAYKEGDICSWQCHIANSRQKNKDICLTDRYIRQEVERRGEDYWNIESVLFELCISFGYISFLAADQWWGVNFKGHWYYDPDLTYSFDEDGSPYDAISGFLLGDEETIGDRKYAIRIEPDNLADGLVGLLAKCVTKKNELKAECAAWEKAHADEVLAAAKVELDTRLADPGWATIQHVARRDYDAIVKRLSEIAEIQTP